MKKYNVIEKVDKGNLFRGKFKNNKRRKGNEWGTVSLLLVLIIFGTINYMNGNDNYQILSILGAYLGFKALGRFIANKGKLDLLFAIGGILIFIGSLILELSIIFNLQI